MNEGFEIGYILVGAAVGLLGWLLYRAGLTIVGAVVGAGFGGSIGYLLSGFFKADPMMFSGIGLVLGIVLGIVLMKALLLYFFFATGAGLGAAVAMQFTGGSAAATGNSLPAFLIIATGAVVGGILLVVLRRYVIALVTSVFGALIFSLGLPVRYQLPGLVVALVVFIAAQVGLVRKFVDKEAFDARTRHRLRETEN